MWIERLRVSNTSAFLLLILAHGWTNMSVCLDFQDCVRTSVSWTLTEAARLYMLVFLLVVNLVLCRSGFLIWTDTVELLRILAASPS